MSEICMLDHDQELPVPEATHLTFGEILAASTMMTEFASLPLECWPGYRYSVLRSDCARSKSPGLSIIHARIVRFVKSMLATLIVAVPRRGGEI